MKFSSLEDIIEEFDLKTTEIPQIKKELQDLLKSVHSGKNADGQFTDRISELMYPKIMSALKFIKSDSLQISKSELAKVIEGVIPNETDIKNIENLKRQIKTEIRSFKKSNLLPKISASAIAVVLSFIWLFPSKIVEHPVLGNLIKPTDWIFTTVWISSIFLTGLFWLISRRKEKMIEQGIKKLNLESIQNNILSRFLRSKEYSAEKENKEFIIFTKDEIVEYFSEIDIRKLERVFYHKPKISVRLKKLFNKIFGLEEKIDIEIAQSLAEITTKRLLLRKVFQK